MKIPQTLLLSQSLPPESSLQFVGLRQTKPDGRWRLATATVCAAALLITVSPAHSAPSAHARQAAKECKAKYNQELAQLQSLQLTAVDRETRINTAYDNLAGCLKANHLLSMLPKRPVAATASRNQPVNRSGTSPTARATPSPTPVPKKTPWMSRSAPQTGTHL